MRRELIGTVSGLMALAACGGAEEPSGSWLSNVHALSSRPACYVDQPPILVPPRTSARIVTQVRDTTVLRESRARRCIERYHKVFDLMRASPDDGTWTVSDRRELIQVDLIGADVSEDLSEGIFGLRLTRLDPAEEGDLDQCMGADRQVTAYGAFAGNESMIDQGSVLLYWTDFAVVMLRDSLIPLMSMHRGCDSDGEISFATVLNYDLHAESTCWNKSGEFVDCEGVNSWPFQWLVR